MLTIGARLIAPIASLIATLLTLLPGSSGVHPAQARSPRPTYPATSAASAAAAANTPMPSPAPHADAAGSITLPGGRATSFPPLPTTIQRQPPAAAPATPTFGFIAPTGAQVDQLRAGALSRIVVQLGWDALEPGNGTFSSAAMTAVEGDISQLRNRGFGIGIDLGLQYPPAWAFSLPGPTRFVDQFGDVWHGQNGTDVVNAVFDPAVRTAESAYIGYVSRALRGVPIASIRVGGLLTGELRYPDATYAGHVNAIWDYDADAQAQSPVAGWRPGSGTAQQAQESINYYYASLTGYETWLMTTVDAAFPGVNQEILFPSWGLRPGRTDAVIASDLRITSDSTANTMISSGLDWPDQVAAIARTHVNATVYTTWLDAPSYAADVQNEAPVAYLAALAAPYHLAVGGENTGGGGQAALDRMFQYAKTYHLSTVMYMGGSMVATGFAGLSLAQLQGSVTQTAASY